MPQLQIKIQTKNTSEDKRLILCKSVEKLKLLTKEINSFTIYGIDTDTAQETFLQLNLLWSDYFERYRSYFSEALGAKFSSIQKIFNELADTVLEYIDPVTLQELDDIEKKVNFAINLLLKRGDQKLSDSEEVELQKLTLRLNIAKESSNQEIISKSNQILKKLKLLSKLF